MHALLGDAFGLPVSSYSQGMRARLGFATALIATAVVSVTGHATAQIMTEQQPMKMAAAEALWEAVDAVGLRDLVERQPEEVASLLRGWLVQN